jgi:UDP-N-acetylglucosamine diphosphorylase/glucosamine-1-phosphate N-acetyltransferase
MRQSDLAAVIMAAGKGKRMKNPDLPKVMHRVGGVPLIEHVVRLADSCGAHPIVIIVGYGRETVEEHLRSIDIETQTAVQERQLGTGHAVKQAEQRLEGFGGDVMILSGDVPLTRKETLLAMLETHRASQAVVTVLTTELPDPTGYGRVIRSSESDILRIVEHKDATDEEKRVREINSGIYIFKKVPLFEALQHVTNDNAQGEYYLPDVFGIFARSGKKMVPFVSDSFDEIRGVNTVEQLTELDEIYSRKQQVTH